MKQLPKLYFFTISAFLFIGCSDTPKDSVSNMYDALQEGNSIKLANNVEEAMSITLISESLKECSIKREKESDYLARANQCLKEKYSNIKYRDIKIKEMLEDNAYVKVTVLENDTQNDIVFNVKKIGGQWMVLSRKKQ
jgi:hypothetical protein